MRNPNDRLAVLMFQFIADKGLRNEWEEYFEANEGKFLIGKVINTCPDCHGSGEHVFGGSFGGPTTRRICLTCKGTGLRPPDKEEDNEKSD